MNDSPKGPSVDLNDASDELPTKGMGHAHGHALPLRKQSDISLVFDEISQDAAMASAPFFIPSVKQNDSSKKGSPLGSPVGTFPKPSSSEVAGRSQSGMIKSSVLRGMSSNLLPGNSGQLAELKKTPKDVMVESIKLLCMAMSITGEFRTLRDHGGLAEMNIRDFHVVKRLGEGSFATVEKCIYVPQNRVVAVKKIKAGLKLSHLDIRDMKKEIALLRKLRHPSIIEFIGYGSFDNTSTRRAEESLFLVEEFVNGGTLKGLIQRQMFETRPLYRMQDAVRWMIEMAQGLKYLHQCQPMVIHRDLKLENILLQGTDPRTLTTKIADFGLSALVTNEKRVEEEEEEQDFSQLQADLSNLNVEASKPSEFMAQTWTENAKRRVSILHLPPNLSPERRQSILMQPTPQARRASILMVPAQNRRVSLLSKLDKEEKLLEVCCADMLSGRTGTLMYMAPEVYRQEAYNEKADVFSYAIICYEILHSYMMISATDGSYAEVQAYARRVARSHYRPPLDQGLPKELMDLVKSCWDPKAELRPSMSEVIKMLNDINQNLDWKYWERAWAAQWQEQASNDVEVIKPESMILTEVPTLKPTSGIIAAPVSGVVAPRPVSQGETAQPNLAAPIVEQEAKMESGESGSERKARGCQCVIS